MRIFVAIKISNSLADKILEWEEKYRNLPARWLKPENLHITLIPPWDEKDIENIKRKLQNIEKVGEFEISFDKVELGPNSKHPRLIWAEGKAPEKFIELKRNLEKILEQYDDHPVKGRGPHGTLRPEEFLHLTIARFHEKIKDLDEKANPVRSREGSQRVFASNGVNWRDTVKSIILYQSETLPEGAKYTVLEEIYLQSHPAFML